MNQLQYLLGKLAEEAAEVAQASLKGAQFGLGRVIPGQNITNAEKCYREIDDLIGVLELLRERHNFGYTPNEARIAAKKVKVMSYMVECINLGTVDRHVKDDEMLPLKKAA